MFLIPLLIACGAGDTANDGPPIDTQAPADTGIPWPDGDCEGTDEDRDGWCAEEGDCDDSNEWVNPGREEDTEDQIDNDCDGTAHEGLLNDCGTCGATPSESCNGNDDDCHGLVDEGADL